MNQFEAARLKYEKNRLSQERPLPVAVLETPVAVIATPKEKPSSDCVIKVTVMLPDTEFSFSMHRSSIYSNANRSRLNAAEIKKALATGLRPLMGEVK